MYRKNQLRSKIYLIIGILLGASALFCMQRWSNQIFSLATTPFLYMQHYVGSALNSFQNSRKDKQELTAELHALKIAYAQTQEKLVISEAIHLKNIDTQVLSEFVERYKLKNSTIAQILLKNLTPEHQFFLVNAGTNKKIEPNMIALYHHQILGKVVEVYPFYCKILLITDPKSRIAAECSKTGTKGIAQGIGNSNMLRLSFAAHFSNLQEQELLISLGTGLIFPRGFGLGTIAKRIENGIFCDAEITPLFDLQEIEYCVLIRRIDLETAADQKITVVQNVQKESIDPAAVKKTELKQLQLPPPPTPIVHPIKNSLEKKDAHQSSKTLPEKTISESQIAEPETQSSMMLEQPEDFAADAAQALDHPDETLNLPHTVEEISDQKTSVD